MKPPIRPCAVAGLIAVVACALQPVQGATRTDDGRNDDPLGFVFDGTFIGSPELSFNFSRSAITRDDDGNTVVENQPRYTGPRLLASAPIVETIRTTNNSTLLLASGLDHDGVTPLLVLYEQGSYIIDVFTVAGDDIFTAEQTGVGRNRTLIGEGTFPDILQGQFPDYAYRPNAGAICHGLIVLMCTVYHDYLPPEGLWFAIATAIVVSTDQGQTWELLFEDEQIEIGKDRGREWTMQNWWPMQAGPDPLEAYFVGTDYRYNAGARGGRTYMFRATRSAVGALWVLEPTVIAHEAASGLMSEHAHVAGVVPFSSGGLRVITAIGDGLDKNRVVSSTRADDAYTNWGWTAQEDYHGSRRYDSHQGVRDDAWTDSRPSIDRCETRPGTEGNQFVGCAPTPIPGGLIVGADICSEQLMRVQPVGDDVPSHPRTEFVYGQALANGTVSECFLIRTPTPELGGPYVSRYSPFSQASEPPDDWARRTLFSPDGEYWGQCWSHEAKGATGCIHGEHIYSDSFINSFGVRRMAIPEWVVREPFCVGPGGLQRGVDAPIILPAANGEITALSQDGLGQWEYEGEPIEPQPPCAGPVFHIGATRWDTSTYIGALKPIGSETDLGAILGTDGVASRWWVLNGTDAKTGRLTVELSEGSSNTLTTRGIVTHVMDTWMPATAIDRYTVQPGASLRYKLFGGSTQPDDQDLFLALDCLIEGVGFPGYPLEPAPAETPGGVTYPDEIASVAGFACDNAWSITLAGEVPDDSWDSTTQITTIAPLATLWGDAANYIELSADIEEHRLLATIVREGATERTLSSDRLYWLRGSAVLVSLSDPGDGSGVAMTVSVGGTIAHEAAVLPPATESVSLVVQPSEIRFSSHHGTSSDGLSVHVTPMLWWGGQISETVSLDETARRDHLHTLDFLSIPVPGSADLDGSGSVDQLDLAILLATYSLLKGDPHYDERADLNGDGEVNATDLGILLAQFDG
ncbi:MAG: hypothetical protein KAS72_09720 [Phycisphaerales bacterium]|nr:hypothetical protein [Phycisphaerales bacterium]